MTRNDSTNPTSRPPGDAKDSPPTSRNARRTESRARKRHPGNAYLGLGNALGSPRDRRRLRERNAAERSRVERMLASAPTPVERVFTPPGSADDAASSLDNRDPRPGLRAIHGRTCPVCTSAKIVTDEVSFGGPMRLSECLHCDHRWTERPRSRWAALGATMNRGGHARVVQVVEAVR